jgi:hypothetical protein
MRSIARVEIVFVAALTVSLPASATTIDPMQWHDLLDKSAFAGVVECTQAGGIVAQYKVIESWKGPPVGTSLRIRVAVNYWEPQYPLTLVGERWVVTGFKAAPSTLMSTTSGSMVPLWWRNIPADYELPMFQGRAALSPLAKKAPFHELGSEATFLEDLRRDAVAFLARPAETREFERLRANALKYSERATGGAVLRDAISQARNVVDVVRQLVAFQSHYPNEEPWFLYRVLSRGGGAQTLEAIQRARDGGFPGSAEMYSDLLATLDYSRARVAEQEERRPLPTRLELAKMKRRLIATGDLEKVSDTLEPLLESDPHPLALWLQRWSNRRKDWRSASLGYELGSWFGHFCKKDRAINLMTLLSAKDPFIRVAAAIYLTFDDEPAANKALAKLSDLPGDAGAWAALRRARSGDSRALQRALQVLSDPGEDNMAEATHRNLQKRVLELLSNSAAAAGLPQPPSRTTDEEDGDEEDAQDAGQPSLSERVLRWWANNKDRVTPVDPWLPELSSQKVD